jgi:hypothetical protein
MLVKKLGAEVMPPINGDVDPVWKIAACLADLQLDASIYQKPIGAIF